MRLPTLKPGKPWVRLVLPKADALFCCVLLAVSGLSAAETVFELPYLG